MSSDTDLSELLARAIANIPAKAEALASVVAAPSQIDDANELLRAALEIIRGSGESHYVKSAYAVTTTAYGGGDGMCIADDIEAYFEQYRVSREPQMPELDD